MDMEKMMEHGLSWGQINTGADATPHTATATEAAPRIKE